MLKGWRAHAHGRPLELRAYEELRGIHERRFPSTDPTRFTRLWCHVAALCNVPPLEMNENQRLVDLNPGEWSLGLDEHPRLENLSAFIVMESRHRPLPRPVFTTVGDVLDYLLLTESGLSILDESRSSQGVPRGTESE
jgi:hypothetical protein